ncbi:hypothetical protein [Actinoplanes sp. NPDC048796]|uniref:hypothetical protein n=1 Tax=Actinoplanes sp. NPDC048796 TaxID=3155640 RepID=UPI0033CA312B
MKLLAKVSKRGQAWLTQAYADNVMDTLAREETSGARAQLGWSQQREREKATLLAEVVATVEMLAAEGQAASAIADHLRERARSRQLTPIGRIGETEEFDRSRHDPNGDRQPRVRQQVRVLRPGFVWSGVSEPVVVAKALVE